MNFTTEEIAGLLGSGHHGPACRVDRVVIDPEQVRDGDGQLFAAFAHPQPLGDTTFVLEDDIAPHVPYLTERWWVGGTAVNGPSTEVMVRAMAGDDRGRPTQCERVAVLGAVAPWVTAALVTAALGDGGADHPLPAPGPSAHRERPGTERFRMPLALLNHADDRPLTVVLNRRHRGCSGADAALLDPTTAVITDLGERHLATLGRNGALDSTREVLDRLHPGATLVVTETVADALRDEAELDLTRWSALSTFRVRTHQAEPSGCTVDAIGSWGVVTVVVGPDGAALALAVGAAVTAGIAAGCAPEALRESVGAAARAIAESMVVRLAEGPTVWDRSDATSVGDVSAAITALADRDATARFLVLGPLDDGPTVSDRLHARLGAQATEAGIVVRSADAWGSGAPFLEHPRVEADDLAAAGPGAIVLLAGGDHELLALRSRLLSLDRTRP